MKHRVRLPQAARAKGGVTLAAARRYLPRSVALRRGSTRRQADPAAIVKFSRNQTRAGQTSSASRLTAGAFGFSLQCDCAASGEKEAVARRIRKEAVSRRIRLSVSALWNGPQLKR